LGPEISLLAAGSPVTYQYDPITVRHTPHWHHQQWCGRSNPKPPVVACI